MTVYAFQIPTRSEGPEAVTGTRIASAAPSISVTVDASQTPKGSKGPKATAVIASVTPHCYKRRLDTAFVVFFAPSSFFPTLAVGLLDFKVDVVLARLDADFRDQLPSIPAVPNRKVSLPVPTIKYPCSAQPPSIPAVPNQ